MSTKDVQEKIIDNMRRWQKIENSSVASTGNVIEKTENPIIRIIMEIIQRDSQMHYRVQDMIANSLESGMISFNPDELTQVWDLIEKHIKLEEKTIELANEAKEVLKDKKMVVQEYLLDYLFIDEQKHERILASLETFKKGMYPYG